MRRYVKLRPVLLGACLLAASWMAGAGYGAASGERSGEETRRRHAQKGVLSLIWENKDPVFGTILVLSIIGVTLIIQGFIKARRSVLIPDSSTERIRQLLSQKHFKELLDFTDADPSFVSKAMNAALKRAPNFQAMREAMETAIAEQTAEQFRRIEYLNVIGNLGPLLGLLGTVLGMIDSFQAMSESGGQADPKVLAGGISMALAHTFLGLMLALPCLAAFGVLRTLIDRLTVQGALIAEELLLMTRPQEAKPASPGARPVIPPPPATASRKPAPPAPAAPPA